MSAQNLGRYRQFADSHKLITAIVPAGKAGPVVQKLRAEKSIITANVQHARGLGHLVTETRRGLGAQSEKDVLTVVVSAEEAESIFEYVYFEAGIDGPHGGIVVMSKLHAATAFSLPDVPEEH
ncbi:MAG TPA: hypothetical protein VIT83_00880 [Gammaproteobacteria bacterium]